LERDIEAYLVKRVKALGGMAYKFVSPSNRGVADRLVVLPGQIWFVEVKQETGRLTALQALFMEQMKRMGHNAIVVWSKEEVDAFIATVSRRGG
jgi:hypothetical protein